MCGAYAQRPAGHPKEKRICILCISLSFVILCLILPVRLPPHGSGFPLLSFFARFSGSALRSAVHRAESLLRVFRVIAVREELDHTVEIRGGILCISAALVCLGKPKERFSVADQMKHILEVMRFEREYPCTSLFEPDFDKSDIVTTFLAVLELLKYGRLRAEQEENFGEIMLYAVEGATDTPLEFLEDENGKY